jgi:hypothetical protein
MTAMLRRRADTDAGRVLFEYYERNLSAWRRQMIPVFTVAFCMALAIAIPSWLYLPYGRFVAGFVLGGSYAMSLWVWDDPPDFIAKWKRGGQGERQTARVLRRLEKDGWKTVHGREAKFGDLDHIAVGQAGVFLLDSKNLFGTLEVTDDGLTATYGPAERDAFVSKRLSASMRGSAQELKQRIQATTRLSYWVQPVVVVWGDFAQRKATHDGVEYIAGDELETWMRAHPARMSRRDAELIQLGLESEIIVPRTPSLLPAAD